MQEEPDFLDEPAQDDPPLVTIEEPREVPQSFTTGRIAATADYEGYFARQLQRHYLNRETMMPTIQGRALLESEYVNLLPDEQIVMRELVKAMRFYHRCNYKQFASLLNVPQYKAEALFSLTNSTGDSAEERMAISSIDQKSVDAAREAGISTMVNALYRTGMRAHDILLDNVENLEPDQQIKLMQASLKLATDMSKSIKGGGRLKVGEMNAEQLRDKLKEAYKLLKIVNAQDTGVVQ